eukprot:6083528-Amphidinium_carterae.2
MDMLYNSNPNHDQSILTAVAPHEVLNAVHYLEQVYPEHFAISIVNQAHASPVLVVVPGLAQSWTNGRGDGGLSIDRGHTHFTVRVLASRYIDNAFTWLPQLAGRSTIASSAYSVDGDVWLESQQYVARQGTALLVALHFVEASARLAFVVVAVQGVSLRLLHWSSGEMMWTSDQEDHHDNQVHGMIRRCS